MADVAEMRNVLTDAGGSLWSMEYSFGASMARVNEAVTVDHFRICSYLDT